MPELHHLYHLHFLKTPQYQLGYKRTIKSDGNGGIEWSTTTSEGVWSDNIQDNGKSTFTTFIQQLPTNIQVFDNCKGILILFVVWYHSLVVYYDPDLTSIPGLTGVETILLLLVMPGFSLLSGFLSSSNLNAKRQDNLFSTGAAFVIFQIINWMMGIFNTIGLDAFLSASSNSSKSSNTSSSSNNTIQYPIQLLSHASFSRYLLPKHLF